MGLGPAPDHEIRDRAARATVFLFLVCPEVEPTYLSDYSALADFPLDFEQCRLLCRGHFGFELTPEQYSAPLWRLLDDLGRRL